MEKQNLILGLMILILVLTAWNTFYFNGKIFELNEKIAKVSSGTSGGNAPADNVPKRIQVNADDDPYLGPKDAKVTVIEFSDYECAYCGAADGTHDVLIARFKQSDPSWEPAVPKLKELAKEGKIKFVYRDFPLNIHKNAQKAAEASECADEQGKFWEYHDVLFENQDALDVSNLKKYAQEIGFDSAKFNECLDSGKMAAETKKDFTDGVSYGVSGTPAFFVNGVLISGAAPFKDFEGLINSELKR